jgi:hypothetical protein
MGDTERMGSATAGTGTTIGAPMGREVDTTLITGATIGTVATVGLVRGATVGGSTKPLVGLIRMGVVGGRLEVERGMTLDWEQSLFTQDRTHLPKVVSFSNRSLDVKLLFTMPRRGPKGATDSATSG